MVNPGPGEPQDVLAFIVTRLSTDQWKQSITQLTCLTLFIGSESVSDSKGKTKTSTPRGSPGPGSPNHGLANDCGYEAIALALEYWGWKWKKRKEKKKKRQKQSITNLRYMMFPVRLVQKEKLLHRGGGGRRDYPPLSFFSYRRFFGIFTVPLPSISECVWSISLKRAGPNSEGGPYPLGNLQPGWGGGKMEHNPQDCTSFESAVLQKSLVWYESPETKHMALFKSDKPRPALLHCLEHAYICMYAHVHKHTRRKHEGARHTHTHTHTHTHGGAYRNTHKHIAHLHTAKEPTMKRFLLMTH